MCFGPPREPRAGTVALARIGNRFNPLYTVAQNNTRTQSQNKRTAMYHRATTPHEALERMMTIPRAARIESITPQLRSRSKQTLSLSMRLRSCEDILAQQVRARLRATFSITLPQFDILSELERANAPLTMSQLSERLMVSNGNVTGIVDRLVRDGLVRRIQAETDRRIHLVQLTMRGAEQYASMANVHNLWVTELFTGLSDCEIQQLLSLLHKTKKSLENQFPNSHT